MERKIAKRFPEAAAKYFVPLRSQAVKSAREINLIPTGNFHWIPGPYTHMAANLTARSLGVSQDALVLNPCNYRVVRIKSDLRFFMYRWMKTDALKTPDEDFIALGIHSSRGIGKNLREKISLPRAVDKIIYHAVNPNARGGRMLLFGDSFTNPLCRDMARYFQEVVSVEYTAFCRIDPEHARVWLKKIAALYQPNCIVVVSHVSALIWLGDIASLLDVCVRP